MNPLVNPGAITATSMVQGNTADEVWAKIIGTHNDFAGRQLSVLQDVYKSESDTNQRNQAIGMLMYAYEYIKSNPAQATDLYTRQCSIGVNAKDLAMMAATLAFGGRNPVTGKQAISVENVPYVLAVMATAGLYDDSGKWLYHTGLPAKSGVGGGIIAVSPGQVRHRRRVASARRCRQQRARPEGDPRHFQRAERQSVHRDRSQGNGQLTTRPFFAAAIVLSVAATVFAARTDVVVLRNGDHLTGEVKQLSREQLKPCRP